MRESMKRSKIVDFVLVLVSAALVFSPIVYSQIYIATITDFGPHLEWAQNIFSAPQTLPPSLIAHSGWQWLVALIHNISNRGWHGSALLVTLGSVLASVGLMYLILRKYCKPLLAGSLSNALMVIAPLMIFLPFDHLWYIGGYVWPNTYHNPTVLLLKPLAILQFWYSYRALEGRNFSWPVVLLMALGSLAAAFAKPSYIICLLPALFILVIIYWIKKKPMSLGAIAFGIVLPSVAILLWQYLLTYSSNSDSQIVFAPFAVMKLHSGNLLPKFLLSIVFPVIVSVVYWKETFVNAKMLLGWLSFGIGSAYFYFLAEMGPLFTHGNFGWSAEITLFLLFAACVLLIAEKKLPPENSFRRWLILASGFMHVYFGVFYYFFVFFTT
jgi:hypothetical protein